MGPSSMLAPFMDDLDDNAKEPFSDENQNCVYDEGEYFQDRNDNGMWDSGEDFNVYSYYDSNNSRFIIQWDNVSNGEDDENCPNCVKETFQLILLDQDMYENAVNQGGIIFVYQEIHDIDENGNFSTIGIESPDQNHGSQIIFNDGDSDIISDLNNGYAIRFSADGNPLDINDANQNKEFSILQTYPNPFNPNLNIEYYLENSGHINVSVYDINGRLVSKILDAYQTSGHHKINWAPRGLSTGSYIVKLSLGSEVYSKQVILLK